MPALSRGEIIVTSSTLWTSRFFCCGICCKGSEGKTCVCVCVFSLCFKDVRRKREQDGGLLKDLTCWIIYFLTV